MLNFENDDFLSQLKVINHDAEAWRNLLDLLKTGQTYRYIGNGEFEIVECKCGECKSEHDKTNDNTDDEILSLLYALMPVKARAQFNLRQVFQQVRNNYNLDSCLLLAILLQNV